MIRKRAFLLFIAVVFTGVAFGQKVKYKDLMVLLNAKQYDQAEPFLKKYLAEVDDNPSAYLFMGVIYQEKAFKTDVLKQTDNLISNVDSAIFFYNKCLPKLTEKEIKKNDENYLMYTRRDLRTGEFGIKLSDIQLDIETRTKALYERRDRVNLLKKYYQKAEAGYLRSNTLFKNLQGRFASKKELFLQADDSLILKLEQLATVFDSSQFAFKNYRSTLQALGKTGYNQIVDLQEIKDFKKEGSSLTDFMTDDLRLWDYTGWAKKTIRIIIDEIYPLRKELVAFDSQINKLREKIKKDSVVVDTQELRNNTIFAELKKWDSDPMPSSLFQMKIAELEYTSDLVAEASLTVNDISKKINLIKQQQVLLGNLDSLSNAIVLRDWDSDAINYKNYIKSAYGTASVLKNLAKSTLDFARREMAVKKKELDDNLSLLKWVISESDSIPLYKDVPDESKYRPLVVTETHTAGVKQLDSLLVGYFYTVTPSRTADLKAIFPVDSVSITQRDLPLIKGLSLATADQSYFVLFYSESKIDGRVPVTLAKISRVAGLEWSSVFSFQFVPVELKFTTTTQELSIKTMSADGDSKIAVIDKSGKRVQ
jgi:hypothetical protein